MLQKSHTKLAQNEGNNWLLYWWKLKKKLKKLNFLNDAIVARKKKVLSRPW